MHVLITGVLWRDPIARQSKADRQFVTCLLKAGTPTDATWVNVVAFDTAAQSELLRLSAGDSVSVQGTAKLGVYEKAGEHRASLDVTANLVLALRQPKARGPNQRDDRDAAPTAPEFNDTINF